MVATACSAAKQQGSQAPTTLHTVMSAEADNLNPFMATEQGKSQILSTIAMPMLYVDSNNKITSKILTSWKVGSGGTTVTLSLKPNLKWSDGQPMTSADLLFSLTAYLDSKISPNSGRIGPVVGADAIGSGAASKISGLSAPDQRTLTVKLAKPDASWIPKLSLLGAYWPVLPSHLLGTVSLDKLPDDVYFKSWPVSSGPYLLSKFVQQQYVEVKRNDQWSFGKAGFQSIVFEILSTDQMTAKLQTGELQYIYSVDPADVDRVKGISGVTVSSKKGVAPELFGLNNAAPELKDPRIRQAMLYGINRDAICKTILAGYCTVPVTNLRQLAPAWSLPTSGLNSYNYDPAKAKQLLAEAGWNPKTKLTFYLTNQRSYVTKIVTAALGQLADVGIHFAIRTVTTAQLLDIKKKTTGWDAAYVSGADFVVDPDEWADYTLCADRYPNGANTALYCDPETDQLLEEGLATIDQAQRASYYQQAFTRLNKDPGEIYMYVLDTIVAYNSHLQGVTVSGNLSGGYWDIANWHWAS